MYQYNVCPVCKSTDFETVLQAKDHTVSGETFSICHCRNCSHRFTNPVPDQEHIGPYYQSEDYISHSNTSKGLINWLYQKVRKRTLRQKQKLVQTITNRTQGEILDVGAGTGAFLGTMFQSGWTATGIEPDAGAREVAASLWDLDLQKPEVFYELPQQKFDVVTMWHVLEHVHDLDGYAEKIKSVLKASGKWVVAVPNYTSYDAEKYGAGWAAYDVPRHLYHFSPASMKALLERHGFKLMGVKQMPFDSFYVSMLSERYRGGNLVRAFWNGFCSYLAASRDPHRCSSLIYLIEK